MLEGHVEEIFSNYGKVNSCRVLIDKVTSFHKGVAYVDFATNEDAKNAIKFMDGGQIDGQPVTVQFTLERQVSPKRVIGRRTSPPRRKSPPKRSPPRRSPPPRRRSPRRTPPKSSPKAPRNRSRTSTDKKKSPKRKRSASSSSSSSSSD